MSLCVPWCPCTQPGVELNEQCGPLQARPSYDPMGLFVSLWGPYGSLWGFMGPCGDLCVPVGSPWEIYGVPMGLYESLGIFVSLWGPHGGSMGSLCVTMCLWGSVCPYGVPMGDVCVPMGPYVSLHTAEIGRASGRETVSELV